jgi:hypothetical protein
MAMLLMLRGTAWVFFSVVLIEALDWFMTWLPKDNAGGVSGVWASAEEPRTRRESKRAIPPKKRLVPYCACLKPELGK